MPRLIEIVIVVPDGHFEIKEMNLLAKVLNNHNFHVVPEIGIMYAFSRQVNLEIHFLYTGQMYYDESFFNQFYFVMNKELCGLDFVQTKVRNLKTIKITIPGIVLTENNRDEIILDYWESEMEKPKDNLVYPVLHQ